MQHLKCLAKLCYFVEAKAEWNSLDNLISTLNVIKRFPLLINTSVDCFKNVFHFTGSDTHTQFFTTESEDDAQIVFD